MDAIFKVGHHTLFFNRKPMLSAESVKDTERKEEG